jgi:hypothetical protein
MGSILCGGSGEGIRGLALVNEIVGVNVKLTGEDGRVEGITGTKKSTSKSILKIFREELIISSHHYHNFSIDFPLSHILKKIEC